MTEVKAVRKMNRVIAKKQAALMLLFLFSSTFSFAQKNATLIKNGNEAYDKKEYGVAIENYKKVTEKEPFNEKANYNLGNALYKKGNTDEALKAYDAAIRNTKSKSNQSDTWYNKGVALQNNKKLPECIDAYKKALRLNPGDEDARFNLQKALQQQQQQQNKEKPKDDPKNKDKQQKQDEKDKKDQQPKPPPPKMTQKEAEEKLKALLQQEKNLQNKLRKVDAASPNKPEKDW